jgi:phosphopantothenoylcysteine decarboxylase / phosphopantothenate---cysteine ligase
MARVLVGITGGIAAYKACELVRLFVRSGHEVIPLVTPGAERFVRAETFFALARRSPADDPYPHLQDADLLVVAPLTANTLAKLAHGLADNLVAEAALAHAGPILVAPAMNSRMWEHPATQANVELLRGRGVELVGPEKGNLAEGGEGRGRMAEPVDIFARAEALLEGPSNTVLQGKTVVVTAGGTREPLDAVRFLGNRSSGRMGAALAAEAQRRGADVTLIASNLSVDPPTGVEVVQAPTAADLARETLARGDADVVVMAAAVADFRPASYAAHKIKKTHVPGAGGGADDSAPVVPLVRNPDVLAGLVQARGSASTPVIVGFAAETGDDTGSVLDHARDKLARKGCDLLVVNEVGDGLTFGRDASTVHLLRRGSDAVTDIGPAPKREVADAVWDAVLPLL